MKRHLKGLVLLISICNISLFGQTSEKIKVNQVGYFKGALKQGSVIGANATTFEIKNLSGQTVFSGNLSTAKSWNETNESVKTIDFSSFDETGDFKISIDNVGESYPFKINNNVLDEVSKEAVRYFYYNRASMDIESTYAGVYARQGAHFDTQVRVCDNPFSEGRAAGSTFSSPGGWYDAGDYNKYLLTAGISLYTLMSTYEQQPEYVSSLNLNIPESNNNIPDLLDECLYEIDWLLTMQDSDGGVYTKLTNTGFGGFSMPNVHENVNGTRYACQKNTSATLQFAAALAAAYRIYAPVDQYLEPGERESWKTAAIEAWDWCEANPNVDASQCGCSIGTGEYPDANQTDEFRWAAAELYLATSDISYYNNYNYTTMTARAPNWQGDKESLGIISLLLNKDLLAGDALSDYSTIESRYLSSMNGLFNTYNNHPYRIMMQGSGSWVWGSNGVAGNQAFLMLTAYHLSQNENYLKAATSNIDYLLGKNTTSYSWFTGFGSKKVTDAHHRISSADGINAPVPGMLFGGPFETADGFLDDGFCCGTQSFANTEVTVNWNAPFAFSTLSLQAINGNVDGPFTLDSKIEGPGTLTFSPLKTEYEKGETVTITQSANSGMVFSHWESSNTVSTENTFTIEMTGNKQLTAYFLTPSAVPGIIESVNYDIGGQGISYNDTDPGNTGDGPRQGEGVDTQESTNGDLNIGWLDQGEWVNYTINVTATDNYFLDIDLASPTGTGSFSIEIDGVNVLDVTSIPNTGDWADYIIERVGALNLAQGIHKMRINITGTGFNLGKMNFNKQPTIDNIFALSPKLAVNVFPNPAEKTIRVEGYTGLASICTIDGIELFKTNLSNETFSVEELPKGIYFLQPKDSRYSMVRFIKK